MNERVRVWLFCLTGIIWSSLGHTEQTAQQPPALQAIPHTEERFRPPLQPLPKLPTRKLDNPTAQDVELLDGLLKRLRAPNVTDRRSALADLLEVTEALLPAIRARIDTEAKHANRSEMKRVLLDIRRETRNQLERQQKASGQSGPVETPDYLEMIVDNARLSSEDWKHLVNVLALSRMCVALGNVEAVRSLIHVYVRFSFLRIDTQLQLAKLDERALPALIETTRHPAPKVAEWAQQRLDFMGKAIPSEAVRVKAPDVLADVLRAYGQIKDPDAARIILSFASSERSQIRLAARQAIRGYGASAIWVLRDGYEQTIGDKPSREWSWDRVAQELFREFDSNRLAEVYQLFKAGVAALEADNLPEAVTQFERLLTRSPDFEPRDAIVSALLRFAQQNPEEPKNWDQVERCLQRVQRLGDNSQKQQAHSLLLTLQARRLAARGVADQFLLRQAIELDDNNQHAKLLLADLETKPFAERPGFQRWLWPGVLGALSLVFIGLLVWTRRFDKQTS